MDSKNMADDIQALKPFGMPCLVNDKYICGTFRNKSEFDKWDGEKWCMRNCIGRKGKPGDGRGQRDADVRVASRRAYSGNPPYRIALMNSINRGLLPMKRLTVYDGQIEVLRKQGREWLRRL